MPEIDDILACETAVWQAMVTGDAAADEGLLAAEYLGVYATGFGDRSEHVGQLAGGPTVETFHLDQARLLPLAPGLALLAYRAHYRRAGGGPEECMYVSSIWREEGAGWRNLFSQDTACDSQRPV